MKPAFFLFPALLSCAAGSASAIGTLAEVAIYDRSSGRELPLHAADGRFFVAGKPACEYEIRIRNQTAGDLLAVISVDGVNVVSGETASESQNGYVIPVASGLEPLLAGDEPTERKLTLAPHRRSQQMVGLALVTDDLQSQRHAAAA